MLFQDPEDYISLLNNPDYIHPQELIPHLEHLLEKTPPNNNIYIQLALALDNLKFQVEQESLLLKLYKNNQEEDFFNTRLIVQDLLEHYVPFQEKSAFDDLINNLNHDIHTLETLFKEK
jgi:glycosyltransferase involved in cell wall biosynthesis